MFIVAGCSSLRVSHRDSVAITLPEPANTKSYTEAAPTVAKLDQSSDQVQFFKDYLPVVGEAPPDFHGGIAFFGDSAAKPKQASVSVSHPAANKSVRLKQTIKTPCDKP